MNATGEAGRVILAGTPLGNVRDASPRLIDALATAAVIAAEDTRRVRRLCADLGVAPPGRVVSFFDGNEQQRVPELLDALRDGRDVLVVTDAGMPSISDPGYRLVAAAVASGVAVTTVPGPSAVTAALAVSGLPVHRFCFEGFLPRKAGDRRRLLESLAAEQRTMVFFEAPHRLARTLADLADAFGPDRPAAVCRELTKTYEQVRRGPLRELAGWAQDEVRGEITLVVMGAERGPAQIPAADLARAVALREASGEPRKVAIAAVATSLGVPRRVVYD
ncbi:MAG TPA: 16S rRNA (cytidine(1402)-2'-O)-methyltransferase, partial [Micromonosporaceae bacterium]